MNRRFFLGGVLAVTGAAVIASAIPVPEIPILYGDMIHDDAPGLNALFARKPVHIRADAARILHGDVIRLENGTFGIGSPVYLTNDLHIIGNKFEALQGFEGKAMLIGQDQASFRLSHCHIRRCGGDALQWLT